MTEICSFSSRGVTRWYQVLRDDVAVICTCTSQGKEPHIHLLQNMLSALFINLVNSNLVCRHTHFI